MRTSYKDAFLKKHNIKLGFMSAFVKAAAYALHDQPAVNAGMVFLWYLFDCHVSILVTASVCGE